MQKQLDHVTPRSSSCVFCLMADLSFGICSMSHEGLSRPLAGSSRRGQAPKPPKPALENQRDLNITITSLLTILNVQGQMTCVFWIPVLQRRCKMNGTNHPTSQEYISEGSYFKQSAQHWVNSMCSIYVADAENDVGMTGLCAPKYLLCLFFSGYLYVYM